MNKIKELPISEYQKRFFLEWAIDPDSTKYNVSLVYKIKGSLNKEDLKKACERFTQDNEVVHARYSEDGEKCFYSDYTIDDFYEELISKDANEEIIHKILRELLDRKFDLTKDVLQRFYLIEISKDLHYFILSAAHHIICDGVSMKQIVSQVNDNYNNFLEKEKNIFSKAVEVENNILTDKFDNQAKTFWQEFIGDTPLNVGLPYKSNLSKNISAQAGSLYFNFDRVKAQQFRELAETLEVTPFILISAIYGIVLSKFIDQQEFLLSYPVDMRPVGFKDVMGCFVNNLPLKIDLKDHCLFSELLKDISDQRRVVKKYQGYSMTHIINDQKKHNKDFADNYFNVGLAQTNLNSIKFNLSNLNVERVEIPWSNEINYELILQYDDYAPDNIKFKLSCRKELFEECFISKFKDGFVRLVDDILETQDLKIRQYSILSLKDYQTIVYDWNKTDKNYPKGKTIYQLFEEQVEQNPQNVALVFPTTGSGQVNNQELTYRELNNKANQLARYIRKQYKEVTNKELQADTLIPLCLERGLGMVIGILAVMKAGGAYVPMDPDYPTERFKHIIQDTDAKLIITQSHRVVKLEEVTDIDFIEIDKQDDSFIYDQEDNGNLPQYSKSTDLAYVIYTSGTTGLPKGVMVEHNSIVDYLISFVSLLGSNKRIGSFLNYCFDASIPTMLTMCVTNASIYLYDIDTVGDSYMADNINVIRLTPSMINLIDLSKLNHEFRVVFGGEKLPLKKLNNLSRNINLKMFNQYGPTEFTVGSHVFSITKNLKQQLIGKAYNNTKTYVLDPNKQPVSIGVIGELYIGGAGLARGYLNRLELTAEKFVSNPFATENDIVNGYTRLYKTGDLVRWLADGSLEYIDRNDSQIKIRGHRVELGEIQKTLDNCDLVNKSVVLFNTKSLVGYYEVNLNYSCGIQEIDQEFIKGYLKNLLPSYMVPDIFIELDVFPLTVNGKLDHKALPSLEQISDHNFISPTNKLESKLCSIWAEILNLEKVGITDDFFRIGGDSILSIQLSSKLRRNDINCSVKDIFDHRTISKLSAYIQSKTEDNIVKIQEQEVLDGGIKLLPIQTRFFNKINTKQFEAYNHYNQSFLVKVPELDILRVGKVISKLVNHHDILRASYDLKSNTQSYNQEIVIPEVKYLDINDYSRDELHTELTVWQSDFDIENGPLFQVGYLSGYADGSARLYFALHHLIVDAVSWRILIEDFKSIYNDEDLSVKTTSYRQYSNLVTEYADNHSEQLSYWNNVLESIPSYPEISSKPTRGEVHLSKAQTESLLQQSSKAYHTEINDLLLAALALALQDWNGSSAQGITLEGHGREHLIDGQDIGNTVGWFTTIYPVNLDIKNNIETTIKHVKENLRGVPDKGIGFGSFAMNKDNNIEFIQLPAISFNYLGQFDNKEELWQIVSEDSGISVSNKNCDNNIININGMVIDGQLSFSVVTQLGQNITDKLSEALQQYLVQIQEHTSELVEQGISYKTPRDYNANISINLLDKLQRAYNEIEYIYPVNSLQQGFIYHVLANPNDDAYRVQLVFDYNQELIVDNYIQAWKLAIEKYPILRTVFNWEEELIQIAYTNGQLNYTYHDISKKENKGLLIKEIQESDRKQRFELTKPTQLRLHIIKQSQNYYTIIRSSHHIITDGWSTAVLINQVHEYYKILSQSKKTKVIKDEAYIKVQHYIQDNKSIVQKYWNKKIQEAVSNDLNPLLTTKRDLDQIRSFEGNYEKVFRIKDELYQQLKILTKELGITTNTLVQFVWHKLINIYTQDQKTIVGTTISGREIPIDGLENSVGLYINTLPLIIAWDNEKTIKEQLKYIHSQIVDLSNHSYVNLSELQMQGKRLFHSLLVYENYPISDVDSKEDYQLIPVSVKSIEKLDYPLGVIAYEHGNCLSICLKSSEEILSKQQAQEHLDKLSYLLTQLSEDIEQNHNKLTTLTDQDYQTIVYDWNKTDKAYPKDNTIYQLFEELVEQSPDNIALVFPTTGSGQVINQELTYQELNNKANQLARYIRRQYKQVTNQELQADTLIPLCLERSLDMVIGILAVMKAGGAYVPMDPDYPAERFNHILKETDAKLIITQSYLTSKLKEVTNINLIDMDNQDNSFIYSNEEATNLPQYSQSTDLAYVIYTSGTTGLPKGVLQTHSNVHRLLSATDHHFGFNSSDVWTLYHSYIFDFSVWELWGALTYGGKLIIPNQELIKDIPKFVDLCLKYKVTVLNQTPSAFYIFIDQLVDKEDITLSSLKYVIFGGDVLNINLLGKWWNYKELNKLKTKLINMYGITETTVHVTYKEIKENEIVSSNIGKHIDDLKVYVLDQSMQPTPVGVIGELYIGGAGLARGYLNRPELTVEMFVINPFATESDIANGYTRLYKTGDLVRWLSDGNIEYIGRNDFQVKIRGYRIELGEIENQLANLDGIKQSVVLAQTRSTGSGQAQQTNSQYLVGYFVSEKLNTLKQEDLLNELSKALPDYMVPSILVELESLPLTVNGKLDRKALPNPEFVNDDTYQAPTTELEISLCNIFADVLGLEKVGITDDFFRIGGDSIVSIRLVGKMKKIEFNISVADIFTYRTIQKLLVNVDHTKAIDDKKYLPFSLVTAERKNEVIRNLNILEEYIEDIYPASYLQTGMLIESILDSKGTYHDVFSYNINKFFNKETFVDVWSDLIGKHPLLRTSFIEQDTGYFNIVNKEIDIDQKIIVNNSKQSIKEIVLAEKENNLPLDEPGLYRFIIAPREDSFVLIYSFHHAITDGWSVASLISEFVRLYFNKEEFKHENMPSYGKFVRNELITLDSNDYSDFWGNYLADYEYEKISFIFDKTAISKDTQVEISKGLDTVLSAKLIKLSKELSVSVDTVLLSAYQILLSKLLNKEDIVLGLVVNNRLQEDGGDKVFGLHLNTIAFRNDFKPNQSFEDLIFATQEYKHQLEKFKLYPYGKLKSDLNMVDDLYLCAFNYVHFHIAENNYKNNQVSREYSHEQTNIPFTLNVGRNGDDFGIVLKASKTFIDINTAKNMMNYYNEILIDLVENKTSKIKDYSLLSKEDYQKIVHDWNATDKDYLKNKTVYQLFEEQVAKNPNNIALVYEQEELTYQELNNKANQLARYIRKQYKQVTNQDLKPDTLLPLCLERSLDMVIAILAVMKAGGAYVPMDPEYPAKRFKHILKDTDAKLIVTQSHLTTKLQQIIDIKLIAIDEQDNQVVYAEEEETNLLLHSQSTDLAYVIYTSGTTGLPKGVMVEHKSISSFLIGILSSQLKCIEKYNILSLTEYVFDIFGLEYSLPLITGSLIRLSSVSNIKKEYLKDIDVIQQTPNTLSLLCDNKDLELRDKVCLVGGEYLSKQISQVLKDRFSNVINMYGPTETTIWSSSYLLNCEDVLIGKPLTNEKIYILDQHHQPVPIGVIGELYIGGAGLARGYLNRPELTAERFVSNPFATEGDIAKGYTRLYKTGDLVRWLPDGNIEYIGRNDFQVKIRGHRIELGEIENQLAKLEGIKQSVVLAQVNQQTNSQYLVGYYLPNELNTLSQEDLLDQLSNVLPDYMVPSILVELESLPLTVNGKLDRKALPNPEFVNEACFVAPTSELEISLCNLFIDVLGLEKVGTTDNFFRVGGNSMLAIKLANRISNELDTSVSIADIFSLKTIKSVSEKIEVSKNNIFEENSTSWEF